MTDDLRRAVRDAARSVPIRLGPNALYLAQRGGPIHLNGGEADELVDAVMAVLAERAPDDLDRFIREQAAADPRFAAGYVEAQHAAEIHRYQDLLGAVELHLNWRHVTKHLTTEQKELLADAVEAASARLNAVDRGAPEAWHVERWWRDDYKPQVER